MLLSHPMLNLDYPDVLQVFAHHRLPGRNDSAAFLIWYLENYYRLDTVEAIDSVCDQRGDRGIDGIYVNDAEGTIDVFQSALSQKPGRTVGDTAPKEFYGSIQQLETAESAQALMDSSAHLELGKLMKRLDVVAKLPKYDVRGVYLSNVDLDTNGQEYLRNRPEIVFVGKTVLTETFISDARSAAIPETAAFDVSGFGVADYQLDAETKALIAPVRATELTRLRGIEDQSLFAHNVRGPIGNTAVNKDIAASIRKPERHRLFPLFHNGITVICEQVQQTAERITITGYNVVNGCQSITAFHANRQHLTDDLRVLTKFVQMNVASQLAEQVTHYSNNQNGVRPRDFMSNNKVQIRLQNDVRRTFSGRYFYEIKRGEQTGPGEVISNETAGLYLMSFDLKEPWATHRKYQVFEDKHADLFARPEVTADRVAMLHELAKCIADSSEGLKNRLFAKYTLSNYMMLYVLRLILEPDETGARLIRAPQEFVRDESSLAAFRTASRRCLDDVIVDLNAELDELGTDFDYRSKLRDSEWVKGIAREIVTSYFKLLRRGRVDSFSTDYTAARQGAS